MIDKVLDFIRTQLNTYLQNKLSLLPTEDAILLSNISQLNESSTQQRR
jgi:hypothetical protein